MSINHTENSYPECIKISCNSIKKKLTPFFFLRKAQRYEQNYERVYANGQ